MKPTIRFGDAMLKGEEFFAQTMRSASALGAAGVIQGDLFALLLHNEPAYLELMMAARWIGARWVPVNWHFKADEVRSILTASGVKLLIGHSDLIDAVRDAIPAGVRIFTMEPGPYIRKVFALPEARSAIVVSNERWEVWRDRTERPTVQQSAPGSAVFFTSGTTGPSKGVILRPPTPAQVETLMANAKIAYGIEPGARVLLSAPLYHSGPSHYATMAALMSCEIVIEPRFDAETTLRRIDTLQLSHAYLVPTMYVRLLRLPAEVKARYDLGSMRFVASTGAPCPPDVKQEMINWWGPVIHESYGSSEMGLMTHIDSTDSLRKRGSAGKAVPGVTLRVAAEDGSACAPGEIGTVYVRTEVTPAFTYLNNAEARRAAEREGTVTLGDLGYLDDEGFLFLVDRRVDVVNSGGTKIYTPEVESVLIQMPEVADCAVYGVPDEEFGEALVAAVETRAGAVLTAAQVRDHVRQHLAGFKVPRYVEFHARLPRDDTGKMFKRHLRGIRNSH